MPTSTQQDPIRALFEMSELVTDGEHAGQSQLLTSAVTDHRGMIEIPAYAALVDSVGVGPCPESVATVTSRLSISAGARTSPGVLLHGEARVLHRDDDSAAAAFTITTETGRVICMGNGRAVHVGRNTGSLSGSAVPESDPVLRPNAGTLPAELDQDLDGRNIITGLAAGEIPVGPLCDLLGLSLRLSEGCVGVDMVPSVWMANEYGTMHGGLIAAALGQACSWAGQSHTVTGQQYRLSDMTVNYFRSPPVEDTTLSIATTPIRIGRRINTVRARMTDMDGRLLAQAIADIHLD